MDELLQTHLLQERANVAANPHYDHPPVPAPPVRDLEADDRAALHLPFEDVFQSRWGLVERDFPRYRFL